MLEKYLFDDRVAKEKIIKAKKDVEKIFSIIYEE
jgi:hypothetical protein